MLAYNLEMTRAYRLKKTKSKRASQYKTPAEMLPDISKQSKSIIPGESCLLAFPFISKVLSAGTRLPEKYLV